ncbi:hypothetical protein MKX03_021738 [Papaver bracteatum]|nr:hypothetical protein MKX03_021738 [Papaver bracteatum]
MYLILLAWFFPLELQYANETNALKLPHQYVPWVTVNKVPLYEIYLLWKMSLYICNAYKGTSLPKACQELITDAIPERELDQTLEFCFVNDDAFPTTKSSPKNVH